MRKLTLVIAVFVFSILPLKADAATVTLTSLELGTNIYYKYQGKDTGSWAGQFHISIDKAGPYLAFCVDLDDWIIKGKEYDATINPITDLKYLGAAWLVNNFGSDITSDIEGAALQAAIWEAIYGDNFTFTPTNGSLLATYYNNYLQALDSAVLTGLGDYSLLDLEGSQMLVSRVPEPSTLLLLGAGLIGLGIFGRKRFKKR